MQPIYNVPIIPNNLRHEETVVQIADALGYLDRVFEDIVLRVSGRIEEQLRHVTALRTRIHRTGEQVISLAKTKRATQVFSSSKYPVCEEQPRYRSIFLLSSSEPAVRLNRTKIRPKDLVLSEKGGLPDKLQFYHVKVSRVAGVQGNQVSEEGLGHFPSDAHSINELLLFNTGRNPYKEYIMSDPLGHKHGLSHMDMGAVTDGIRRAPDEAPLSISQRAASGRAARDNYFYTPGLGDVPAIDVPLDLPDLPGIADDLRYLRESGPGIAPSVTSTPLVPDLPSIVQSPLSPTTTVASPAVPSAPLVPALPSPVSADLSEISGATVVPASLASQEPAASQDSRASLMEAIRRAGGLKDAKLRVSADGEPGLPPIPLHKDGDGGGGDLMADLHAKLALRRKGISGARNADGSGAEVVQSAMTRVSAMIPPPTACRSGELAESTATTEEDDDEADWDE